MKMIRKLILAAFCSLIVASCSNAAKVKLGVRSVGPEADTVSEREHLKIPTIMTEMPVPQAKSDMKK
jgi:hypothetical protein